MTSIVTQIVGILTAGISNFATAIGSGINNMVSNLFIVTTGTGDAATQSLTIFGGLVCVFAGISLVIGLSRWATNWVSSFGK